MPATRQSGRTCQSCVPEIACQAEATHQCTSASGAFSDTLYTPPVVNTPKVIDRGLDSLSRNLRYLLVDTKQVNLTESEDIAEEDMETSLIVVDEADRLKMTGLEHNERPL